MRMLAGSSMTMRRKQHVWSLPTIKNLARVLFLSFVHKTGFVSSIIYWIEFPRVYFVSAVSLPCLIYQFLFIHIRLAIDHNTEDWVSLSFSGNKWKNLKFFSAKKTTCKHNPRLVSNWIVTNLSWVRNEKSRWTSFKTRFFFQPFMSS